MLSLLPERAKEFVAAYEANTAVIRALAPADMTRVKETYAAARRNGVCTLCDCGGCPPCAPLGEFCTAAEEQFTVSDARVITFVGAVFAGRTAFAALLVRGARAASSVRVWGEVVCVPCRRLGALSDALWTAVPTAGPHLRRLRYVGEQFVCA